MIQKTLHHQARCGAELARYPGPRSRSGSVSPRNRTTAVPVDVTPVPRVRMTETRRRSWRVKLEGRNVCFRRALPLCVLLSYENVIVRKVAWATATGWNRNGGAETSGAATSAMNRTDRTSATKWEASGTAAQATWRHRVSSLFCHSTTREKGARTTSRAPFSPSAMPFFLAAVPPPSAEERTLLDDSPRGLSASTFPLIKFLAVRARSHEPPINRWPFPAFRFNDSGPNLGQLKSRFQIRAEKKKESDS